jgi:hypothetical protein
VTTHSDHKQLIHLQSIKAVKYSPAGLPSTSDTEPASDRLNNCDGAIGDNCVLCIQTVICLLSLVTKL